MKFYEKPKDQKHGFTGVAERVQGTLFDLEIEQPAYQAGIKKINKHGFQPPESRRGYFQLHNRRYLGNKHKLLGFIEDIVLEKCGAVNSLCDIFAGSGVVGARFNNPDMKIIANDFLSANYVCLRAFLGTHSPFKKTFLKKALHC